MKRLWITVLLLAGCDYIYESYFCQRDEPCNGKDEHGWICVYDGKTGRYCAEPDKDCPSGYRFDSKTAGSHRSDCVDPQYVPRDGGTDGPDAATCN